MKIFISGQAATGVRACLILETDKGWIPFNMSNVGRTKEFMPEEIHEINFQDEIGMREFLVSIRRKGGMDNRERYSQAFLITTG